VRTERDTLLLNTNATGRPTLLESNSSSAAARALETLRLLRCTDAGHQHSADDSGDPENSQEKPDGMPDVQNKAHQMR
jgi:hypothetical protein